MALTKVTMGLLSGLAAKVLDIMKDHSNINLGEAKAATGTFVDFMIPEGVKRVTVMFDGMSINGATATQVQIGSGVIETTDYNAGGTRLSVNNMASARSTSGFSFNDSNPADVFSGEFTLSKSVGNLWVGTGSIGGGANAILCLTSGSKTLSGPLDLIRITTVNGTSQFDAGTINISWEF